MIYLFSYLIIFNCDGSSLLCDLFSSRVSGGYTLVALHEPLIALVSLVAEHGL